MKRALLFIAAILLIPAIGIPQMDMVNVHPYSRGYLKEDSSASITWLIADSDIDTSQTIDIKGYTYLGTLFNFGYNTAAGGDSIAISVHGIASWDDTVYVLVDSVAASPLITSELVTPASNDTAWYQTWSLPPAPYFRIILKGHSGATDKATGVNATIKYYKMK